MASPFSDALRPLREKMAQELRSRETEIVARYKAQRDAPPTPPPPKPAFKHHPTNHTLYAYNNNEQANLNQLVTDCPPEGGWAAYLADMDRS